MRKEIISQDGYMIYQIDEADILCVVEFVVRTNYKKHKSSIEYQQIESEIVEIYESEKKIFDRSCFYIATTITGQIVGALRIMIGGKYDIALPDSVNLNSINNICHIGRFAIDQIGNNKLGNKLFKEMVLLAFSHVCKNKDNVLVAECDMKLHRVLVKMGIGIIPIGPSFFCLGSETISVYAPCENVIEYYLRRNCCNNYKIDV